MTTLWSRSFMNVQMINEEHEIKQFITRLNYFKSKAIASQRSIALVFTNNSNVIQVVEEKGSKYKIKVPHGKITNIARINTLNFNRDGNINRFGSLTIAMNKATYKIILHIEKGRIRYVKI
ncbi:competence protein ComGD [Staphylococcus capitis]|nr:MULTISPECIES: competence type IV pilus minor pilin ComGD [Staphylococcus]